MSLSWIVEGRLGAMGAPRPGDLDRLAAAGVGSLLSLTERAPAGLPRPDLRHLHLPIRDFAPPSPAELERAVAFIDAGLAAGAPVVVHCGAGLGRTGTICAAWLVTQGLDAAQAITAVRRRRPGSVETEEQEDAVFAFAEARRRAGGAP